MANIWFLNIYKPSPLTVLAAVWLNVMIDPVLVYQLFAIVPIVC